MQLNRQLPLSLILGIGLTSLPGFIASAAAGERIWVPIRWCGVEGAPSMADPGVVNETSTDDVLWRRHERPTDAVYQDVVDMTFRAGATAAIKNGPQSFPIIRDPVGTGGDIDGDIGEDTDVVGMCRRAWMMGDPLYFDQNNNSIIDNGIDTLLSTNIPTVGSIDLGHGGATLNPLPGDVGYVDTNTNGTFNLDTDRIYRDENLDGLVDSGDTLLVNTLGTVVGDINAADSAEPILALPSQIKYLDLIRQPGSTYNIGYPSVQGIVAVSANDLEFNSIPFPVHGVALSIGSRSAVMDDPSQYLPPGPDFTLFETQLVAHEFGHAMRLNHGNGIDNDSDGILDEVDEGDPASPFIPSFPGTLCDANNIMQYCWRDDGTSGFPNMVFIGSGTPTAGTFTADLTGLDQAEVLRDFALTSIPDRIVDPVTPPLNAARVDIIGDVPAPFEHIDITDFSLGVDAPRENTIFSLTTRRPFPPSSTRAVDFHYLLDLDNNPATGGAPAAIVGGNIPTDFTGAEYASTVSFTGSTIDSVAFWTFDPGTGQFILMPDRVQAIRDTVESIPDFPFDRRNLDPDNPNPGEPLMFPSQELIRLIVPTDILTIPADATFRVAYISHEIDSGLIDRARTPGMNFQLPVFPECQTNPEVISQGQTTDVIASGLLPNRDVHLLLGATEVGTGVTDSDGRVTLPLAIPTDARVGDRLVTVGALAVTADCSVTVEGLDGDGANVPQFAIAVHGGVAFPHDGGASVLDPGISADIGLEHILTSHTSILGIFGYHHFDDDGLGTDIDTYRLSLNGRYYVDLTTDLQGFGQGGAGAYIFSPGDVEPGINLGLGLQYDLSESLSLESLYDYHFVIDGPTGDFDFSTLSIGVNFRF